MILIFFLVFTIDIRGEKTSACTKSTRRLNEALYDANKNQSVGRKIDILIKHDEGDSDFIELNGLEVKPANTTPALVKEQQNKNLRTNGDILAYLASLIPQCPALQTTATIDFLGKELVWKRQENVGLFTFFLYL